MYFMQNNFRKIFADIESLPIETLTSVGRFDVRIYSNHLNIAIKRSVQPVLLLLRIAYRQGKYQSPIYKVSVYGLEFQYM